MSDAEDERAVVKTYVPAYQKEAWVEHADELDMSQSEFVRTMVQAGRRDFEVTPYPEAPAGTESGRGSNPTCGPDGGSAGGDDDGDAFADRVYALLQGETKTWDELLEAVTDDVEGRLEDALQDLQAENRVVYSGRNGGYEAIDG